MGSEFESREMHFFVEIFYFFSLFNIIQNIINNILLDRYPGMGPLNGIVSGFAETDAPALLLTGTDLPFGESALALRLEELRRGADACILQRGKKGMEPLFAIYARPCLDAAKQCLDAGRRSFFAMLETLRVRYVTPEELPGFDLERILSNINTPEEYAQILK